MDRQMEKLSVDCDADRISSNQWRAAFPQSFRIRNVVAIAEALQRRPSLDLEDPTALVGAISAEHAFFTVSTGDYDYVMRVSDCLQKIRRAIKDLQGPGMMPPLLGSDSRKDIAIPTWYFMVEPITDKYMVARYLKQPAAESSQNVSVPHGPFPRNIIKRRQKQLAGTCGPFKSLLQRHNEITGSLKKLLSLFLWKFNRTRKLDCLSVQASCDRLTNDLKKLTAMLETLEKESAVMDLKIKDLEDLYATTMQQIFDAFLLRSAILLSASKVQDDHNIQGEHSGMLGNAGPSFAQVALVSEPAYSHDTVEECHQKDIPEADQQDQPDLLSHILPPEQPQHFGLDDELLTLLREMECMLKLFKSNGDHQAQGGDQMARKRTRTRRKRIVAHMSSK